MHSNQQTQLTSIIGALKRLKPQIFLFKESMQDFKKRLETVSNQTDFLTLLDDIGRREQEFHHVLQPITAVMDKALFNAIQIESLTDAELNEIMTVFEANSGLSNLITATRERLGEEALYDKLSGKDKQIAKDFIQRLKQLRSVEQLLDAQKKVFQQRLMQARNLKTLADIEDDILAQHQGVAKVYEAIIFYPKEEDVAAALVEYFETNPQLLSIINAFNFYDSLKSDLADAQTRIEQP